MVKDVSKNVPGDDTIGHLPVETHYADDDRGYEKRPLNVGRREGMSDNVFCALAEFQKTTPGRSGRDPASIRRIVIDAARLRPLRKAHYKLLLIHALNRTL